MKKVYISFYNKRLRRSFIVFTLLCLAIGFATGVVVGKSTVKVEATSQPIILPRHILSDLKMAQPNREAMMCTLTAYCKENYPHICNNGDSTYTATGTTPTVGRTVAVDPSIIPYGSEVIINGHTYIAEDCGGAVNGNRIDILFETHEEALRFGVQYAEMYVVK